MFFSAPTENLETISIQLRDTLWFIRITSGIVAHDNPFHRWLCFAKLLEDHLTQAKSILKQVLQLDLPNTAIIEELEMSFSKKKKLNVFRGFFLK